jgi:hypothetical protein
MVMGYCLCIVMTALFKKILVSDACEVVYQLHSPVSDVQQGVTIHTMLQYTIITLSTTTLCLLKEVTLSLHNHYEVANVLAEAVVHAECHTSNGSDFLHFSQD